MKKLSFKIVGILIGLLIGIVAGELAIRLLTFGTDGLRPQKMKSMVGIGQSGLITTTPYDSLLYELKPNLQAYYKMVPFSTNSLGLHDREYTLDKPDSVFRIALIGDSFAMSSGVPVDSNFSSLLEYGLNQGADSIQYEVLNFGVAGYNLQEYKAIIRHKLPAFSPDLIIVGFCGKNDFNVPGERRKAGVYTVKKRQHGFFRSYLWLLLQGWKEQLLNRPYYADEQLQWVDYSFGNFREMSEQAGTPILIYYLSMLENTAEMEKIRDLAGQHELLFAHSLGKFEGKNLNEYVLNRLDGHPNEKANRLFYESLFEYMTTNKVLFARLEEGIDEGTESRPFREDQ